MGTIFPEDGFPVAWQAETEPGGDEGGYRPPLFKGSKDVGTRLSAGPWWTPPKGIEPSRMETSFAQSPAFPLGVILIASTVLLFSPMLLGLKVSNLVI